MTNRKLQLLILLLIALITFVVNNGTIEANIMEARNLTTAREMLEKHNWLEPTMNGELRLEKPPLPTWIAAGSMYLFGEENLSLLRLPAALAAMFMVFSLFKLSTQLSDDYLLPFLVAGTASTSFYIFFLARDISWDIFCHSFMIGAIWQIHKGLNKNGAGWGEFISAAVLMGLSFLSKGPVAFYALLLPYLLARSFTYGWQTARSKKMALTVMVVLIFIISFWWPLYIWFSHPGFSELIARQESSAWLERSTHPFYHYWSFPVQTGVWAIIAAIALCFPYARERINRFGSYTFLMLWVVSAVVLLSLFPEKKERYLLPVLLPLAMLIAFYFRYLIDVFRESTQRKADRIIFRFNTILMALFCIVIPVVSVFIPSVEARPGLGLTIFIGTLFWSCGAFLVYTLRREKPLWLWLGMVGMVLSVCLSLMPLAPGIAINNPAYRSYKELRHRADLNGIPFYFNGEIPGKFIEVIWNSGREVKGWNPAADQQLPVTPPLLFLSNKHPSDVLPATILTNHHIEVIGHFDGNPGKRGGNVVLSNYATLIR
jgi:4-amino-4-deoxy-L-arabinose transferase-like glycosyltransferase